MNFWTKPKINLLNIFSTNSSEQIESYISQHLFPGTHPVIFSSARVGIMCILKTLRISRGSNVLVPKYGSHCLWNSIGSIANPTSIESEKISTVVSYKDEHSQYNSKKNQSYKNILPPLRILNSKNEKELINDLDKINFSIKTFMAA